MAPTRCCVLCKRRWPKNELYRLVSDHNVMKLDELQRENTRGVYLCKNEQCITRLLGAIEKGKLTLKIAAEKQSIKDVLNKILVRMGE